MLVVFTAKDPFDGATFGRQLIVRDDAIFISGGGPGNGGGGGGSIPTTGNLLTVSHSFSLDVA